MQYIVTAEEMKCYENFVLEKVGISSLLLMERAAMEMADVLMRYRKKNTRILAVAGTGNNGGDALAVGRILAQRGAEVCFYMPGDCRKMSRETRKQASVLRKYGFSILRKLPEAEYDIVIDGLFGTGLSREVAGVYKRAVDEINGLGKKGALVASVDIPSGVCADTGGILGCCVQADITVTFEYAKLGHYLYPGREAAGKLFVRGIGLDRRAFSLKQPSCFSFYGQELRELLPQRDPAGHKGVFGRVALIAGSKDMAGAAVLCGRSVLRTGAGMVKIITPDTNRGIIQRALPEAMLYTYRGLADPEKVEETLSWADVIVAGPGMGKGKAAEELILQALTRRRQKDGMDGAQGHLPPMVLDADALNLIAEKEKLRDAVCAYERRRIILTPHPGEFTRLSGLSMEEYKQNRQRAVRELAQRFGCIVAGKDAVTMAAAAQGGPVFLNLTGNDGMATAGSGDVLAGMIGGLLAQKLAPYEAACLGICLHGSCGDAAAAAKNRYSVTASDLIEEICHVFNVREG